MSRILNEHLKKNLFELSHSVGWGGGTRAAGREAELSRASLEEEERGWAPSGLPGHGRRDAGGSELLYNCVGDIFSESKGVFSSEPMTHCSRLNHATTPWETAKCKENGEPAGEE